MEHQEIYLEPSPDGESYPITGTDVQIHTCRVYERPRDSSKVRSRAIIDFRWETKFYDGRLVAVHKDGNYLAYVLHNRNACSVRVINRSTKARALIKNFVGQAVDLMWSFDSWPPLLAITDEGGNLVVYAVEETDSGSEINVKKYLLVKGSSSAVPRQAPHRVVWCPYVPDRNNATEDQSDNSVLEERGGNAETDDSAHLLAVYHGSKVDVLYVDKILKEYGDETTFSAIEDAITSVEIDADITAVAISPDATALSLSSHGGEVKFYILDADGGIKHARSWPPHKGRPVTSIVFLDNYLVAAQSENTTFWKYALTASDGNRELKLWNCETWICIGTLCIDPPEAQSEHTPLALTADWTSSYIFLTDIERKSLYVVEIVPSFGRIRFATFTEFPLLYPALSIATGSAGPKRFRPASPGAVAELEDGDDSDDTCSTVGVQAFLYVVNPKSLMELDIRYVRPHGDDIDYSVLSSMTSCKMETIHDELSDMSSADLLRIPPSALDVAKATGTDFSNFGARRRSTPQRSDSPNDRTPTRELELNRRISASPSSQEVSKILANPLADAGDDPSCLININHTIQEDHAPVTPTAQSLYTLTSAPSVTAQPWNQSDAVAQKGNSLAAIVSDHDALNKMSTELARITVAMSRQEDQLQHLKHLVSSQQSMWEAVSHMLQDHHRQGSEAAQSLRQCIEALQSDHFQQNLIRTVETVVQRSVDSTLADEMRNVVISCVTEALKPLKDTVQAEVAEKLTSTDAVIRENIGKMIKSKQIIDSIGQAAGQAAASVATAEAHAAYRESFQKVIAPSFESTTRGLFTQMNDAFQHGTKEYVDQLQRQSDLVQTNMEDCRKGVMNQMSSVANHVKTYSEQLSVTQTSMDEQFEMLSKRLQESLYSVVRGVVKDEVAKAVADGQQALNETVMKALRSQASTPVPSVTQNIDRQVRLAEIDQCLKTAQYNTAFDHALQARDIYFVNYLCQRVDPVSLFSGNPCPLQPPVILSLLHQLSCDLASYTENKLKYMHEAIPSLDPKSLGDLGINTINQVHDKLGAFLQSNPGPHVRRAKTVYMLLASLKSH